MILSATQRSNVGTMLQPFKAMSQQCCNAQCVALKIVVGNRFM